jgi:hypothetical protein
MGNWSAFLLCSWGIPNLKQGVMGAVSAFFEREDLIFSSLAV